MLYLKSFIAGVVGALLATALWILLAFVLPVFGPMVIERITNSGGSGGIGAVSIGIGSASILLAGLIGFGIGAAWAFRRFRVAYRR